MYFYKIYLHVFFFSTAQTSSSAYIFETSLHASYLDEEICMTLTAYKFLDIGIVVRSISHVQIAIGDNQGNRIHTSCYVEHLSKNMQISSD